VCVSEKRSQISSAPQTFWPGAERSPMYAYSPECVAFTFADRFALSLGARGHQSVCLAQKCFAVVCAAGHQSMSEMRRCRRALLSDRVLPRTIRNCSITFSSINKNREFIRSALQNAKTAEITRFNLLN
jgi:hypothetical protein